jgi:hypothetical protein
MNTCTLSNDNSNSFGALREDSPFFEMLKEHALVVQNILTAASSFARVAIVTNAKSPWLTTSSDMYLPGLPLRKLLEDLKIRVYYARDTMPGTFQRRAACEASEGVNPYAVAKRCAMSRCLRRLYPRECSARWNVICIGDSINEQDAIKDLLWCNETAGKLPLCKTIKFMEDPTAQQLMNQLHVTLAVLEKIVNHSSDLDLSMETWETTQLQSSSEMSQNCVDLELLGKRLAVGRMPGRSGLS